jgi:hypothetical protein
VVACAQRRYPGILRHDLRLTIRSQLAIVSARESGHEQLLPLGVQNCPDWLSADRRLGSHRSERVHADDLSIRRVCEHFGGRHTDSQTREGTWANRDRHEVNLPWLPARASDQLLQGRRQSLCRSFIAGQRDLID